MKTVDFELQGRTLHLFLNGAALFDYYETYGSDQEIVERITGDSKASFRATCWVLAKLSEQGSWPGGFRATTMRPGTIPPSWRC